MKPPKARSDTAIVDEIVETLKRVPTARLRIVRDVVEEFAEPHGKDKRGTKQKRVKKQSLLDTPFCGMWADRTDIVDSQPFARALRQGLESGGR
jgi:hypothetical protein